MIKKDSGLCEDAFFLQENAAGISDGVGGWSDYGITSSSFSKSLMKNCSYLIKRKEKENYCTREESFDSSIQDSILFGSDDLSFSYKEEQASTSKTSCIIDPSIILGQAYERVSFVGSATGLVCVLNERELSCANIGDSRFLLVRFDDKDNPFVLLQSSVQQHVFNTPYQLAKIPSVMEIEYGLQQQLISPHEITEILSEYEHLEFCQDPPESAQLYQTTIQEGDLLILATDGLFDNLFLKEIMQIIRKTINGRPHNKVPPKEIAHAIALRAYERSKSRLEESPFGEELKKNGEPENRVRM